MARLHIPVGTGPSGLSRAVFALRLAGISLLASHVIALPVAYAQATNASPESGSETTLPEVKVTATTEPDDGFITQGRPASVGKRRASIQDTPFSISVVDVAQARESGATNIESALLYTAGVYAGRYGFDTRGDWSAIRGLTPSTYQDGLRSLYGSYNNVRSDIYTLERVEVLKGPASVMYGQAELGGIVNTVSKLPQSTPSREVEMQIGAYGRKQIAIDMTGPVNQEGTLLYRLVAMKRNSDTQVDYVNDDAQLLMPSLTWKPNNDTSATLLYTYQENNTKVSSQFLPSMGTLYPSNLGFIPSSRFAGEPGWDRYDMRKHELALFVDQRLNENWKAKLNLRKTYSFSLTREIYTRVGQVPDAAGNIQRTINAANRKTDVLGADFRLEGDLKLGPTRHQVTLGLDYQNALWAEWDYVSTTLPGTFNIYNPVYGAANTSGFSMADTADNKIIQTGIYLMDHMEWGPWAASAALRRDQATNSVLGGTTPSVVQNGATTGQVGLMYRLANGISPYISTSEAFVPNLGTDGAGGYLKPTTGTQDEFGVKYLAPSGNTSMAIAHFNIKQKNRVVAGATPGGVEQVGSLTDGWEVEARHRVGRMELMGNYAHMSAKNDLTKARLSSVAERTASAWAQYHFSGGWRAGAGSRYIGTVTGANNSPEIPSVALYDAMVGYTVGKWDWRFNIQNIADREYVSWCRGVNQDCGYGSGRNMLLTANFKF